MKTIGNPHFSHLTLVSCRSTSYSSSSANSTFQQARSRKRFQLSSTTLAIGLGSVTNAHHQVLHGDVFIQIVPVEPSASAADRALGSL